MTMTWSQKEVLRFIDEYKRKPILWDIYHDEYRNKYSRHEALTELAELFQTSKVDIEKKIRNLQTTFSKEKKKVKDSMKRGNGRIKDMKYIKSHWYAYKPLSFLDKTRSTIESDYSDLTDNATTSKHEETSHNTANVLKCICDAHGVRINGTKRKICANDEYSLFGEQIACKIRRLKSIYARVTLQQSINNLLYQAELGKLNNFKDKGQSTDENDKEPIISLSRSKNSDTFTEKPVQDFQDKPDTINNTPMLINDCSDQDLTSIRTRDNLITPSISSLPIKAVDSTNKLKQTSELLTEVGKNFKINGSNTESGKQLITTDTAKNEYKYFKKIMQAEAALRFYSQEVFRSRSSSVY